MAAEQRHDARAVLRQREDRRLVALVGEERREDADQDAGGADADDRPAGGEEGARWASLSVKACVDRVSIRLTAADGTFIADPRAARRRSLCCASARAGRQR